MGYCSADNFNSLEDPQKSKYNLKSRLCILDHDYYIQGDDESTVYTYIQVKIDQCHNTETITCANKAEIVTYLQNLKINLVYTNSVFKFSEYI